MPVVILVVLALVVLGAAILAVVEGWSTLRTLYNQGGEQHWDLLGDRVGLLHGHDAEGGHVLDGQRQGVWLHVEAEGAWMVVRGRIEAPMPHQLRVVHRRTGRHSGESVRVGSPILDSLIHAQGEPPTARLLREPELAGVLLAVVHAWPGSSVDERHVTLRYPDTLGKHLEERCVEVIALVEALRRVSRKRPPGQRVVTLEMLQP